MNPSVPSVRVNALPLLTVSALILGLVALVPLPAHAAEQRLVGDVVVGPQGVEHNVSTGAGDLEVHGLVENDVHSGFGDVLVSGGKVRGDIDAGFGDVKIKGPVEGDVHAEFGDVYVNAPVKGDVSVGWGDVDLGPEAAISGNLECEGCEITGNRGAVKGDMMARGMALDFDESHGPGILGFVGWLFAALAFAACAVLAAVLAPGPLASAASRAEESPGRSFVYGLVSLPVIFVLCVVLAVSIVGIPLLLLLVPAYLALLFFGALVAAFFLGTRVLMVTGRYRVGNALAAVVGAMILAAITLIPVLGDLLLYALSLLGTGAIILALFSRRRPRASHPSYEAYVRDRAGG
ncbi:MAG: polymer-forming cytoskeletal protein [Actinomycetota bacterium]|nr:polymer-forming cytoskeletal protein [Actinomycetota bacterium]